MNIMKNLLLIDDLAINSYKKEANSYPNDDLQCNNEFGQSADYK